MDKIIKKINFKFEKTNLIPIGLILLFYLCTFIFHISEIYENSFLENLQLLPLLIAGWIALSSKKYKKTFILITLIIFLMIARELSYGRVIFCQLPDNPHEFYQWSHYKYGYLANIIIGLYIFSGAIWTIVNKVYVEISQMLIKTKFPFWMFFNSFILIILQIYFEKHGNSVIEEVAELGLYCFVVLIVLTYKKQINRH